MGNGGHGLFGMLETGFTLKQPTEILKGATTLWEDY